MKFEVKFSETTQGFNPQFGEVHNVSDGGYERGYDAGYVAGYDDGKTDGKIKVSTLPNFKGESTGNGDEYYYGAIATNGIWSKLNFIPFSGQLGATYLMTSKMKCDTADNIGVGFVYEDGTTTYGNRGSNKNYFISTCLSNTSKKVTHLALSYGTGGSGYVKDWVIETLLEGID